MSKAKNSLSERKELLPKIFAALYISRDDQIAPPQIDEFAVEQFLGALKKRAQELARKTTSDRYLMAWFTQPDIIDEIWERINTLGRQDRTLGVVTFSEPFVHEHKKFLALCRERYTGFVRMIERTMQDPALV